MDCFVATLLARTTNTAFLYWLHFQSDSEEHRTAMRLEGWPRGSCLRLSRQSKSKLQHRKHQAASPRCLPLSFDAGALAMDQQLRAWKLGLDRFWSAAAPDYREATRLVAEIAGSSADETLRKAAAQALPSLRHAMLRGADQMTKNVARRSLGRVGAG